MNRRDLIKFFIAAGLSIAAAPALAAVNPLASMTTDSRTFYVSTLITEALDDQNKQLADGHYDLPSNFVSGRIQAIADAFRAANPETEMILVIDIWQETPSGLVAHPGGSALTFPFDKVYLIDYEGTPRLVKNRQMKKFALQ